MAPHFDSHTQTRVRSGPQIVRVSINMSNHKNEAFAQFREAVVSLIGLAAWSADEFEVWWAGPGRKDAAAIREHVVRSAGFQAKHALLFDRMYSAWHDGHAPPAPAVDMYLDLVRRDPDGYTVESLQADLESGMYRAVAPPLAKPPPAAPNGFNVKFVQAFEAAFGRPMFVQEYFRYADGTDFADSAIKHRAKFARMKEIWSAYTGRVLHEYEYISRFLFVVDNDDFFTRIVEELCASSMYADAMQKNLVTRYATMYGRSMDAADVDHLMKAVRREKLTVTDDALDARIVAFKDQTDAHNAITIDRYTQVLGRAPDDHELIHYLALHRSEPAVDVADLIEVELMSSLEYHDVIKGAVRRLALPDELPPRRVFAVLNAVLKSLPGLRAADLDSVVLAELVRP